MIALLRAALPLLALLPVVALAHGDDFSWPAQFTNASGTPCCTLNHGAGDCVQVSREIAQSLKMGSTVAMEFPSGYRVVRINAIHIGHHPAICATGCLFSEVGS